jgi:hypothetical protein
LQIKLYLNSNSIPALSQVLVGPAKATFTTGSDPQPFVAINANIASTITNVSLYCTAAPIVLGFVP